MKTKLNLSKLFSTIIMALLFIGTTSELMAQEKNAELKDFKIIIEKTGNEIKLKSEKGSAWINLSFSMNNNQTKAVDEFGMTELENISGVNNNELADFLFTITKTKKGITLHGIKGTAWTELNFSLAHNKKQAINQFGMTSLK